MSPDRSLAAEVQSVLAPHGPQAERLADLWWLLLIVSVIVWGLVMAALAWALLRRRREPSPDRGRPGGERGKVVIVSTATAATALILVVLVVYSVVVVRGGTDPGRESGEPLRVEVVGHQWWWEITYLDDRGNYRFTTANELRVPAGRRVIVDLSTRDVIHSFWVPSLQGKTDLVPGRRTSLSFVMSEPGEVRGQCAEFCGLQHAKMAFWVVALTPGAFEAWAEDYRQPARAPVTAEEQRGAEIFQSASCSMCHRIRGTSAWGTVAPDLTHVASRRTLAAGTLPNTRGHLAGWITDPQGVKPGSFMPPTAFGPLDLQALLTYLRSLE